MLPGPTSVEIISEPLFFAHRCIACAIKLATIFTLLGMLHSILPSIVELYDFIKEVVVVIIILRNSFQKLEHSVNVSVLTSSQ